MRIVHKLIHSKCGQGNRIESTGIQTRDLIVVYSKNDSMPFLNKNALL